MQLLPIIGLLALIGLAASFILLKSGAVSPKGLVGGAAMVAVGGASLALLAAEDRTSRAQAAPPRENLVAHPPAIVLPHK